jgi:hypothetical protein
MKTKHILVAGAVTNDWFTFQQPDDRDLREPWRDRTTGLIVRKGGVGLLSQLLREGFSTDEYHILGPSSTRLNNNNSGLLAHAVLDMVPVAPESRTGSFFKVERMRRIANQKSYWFAPDFKSQEISAPAVLVLVDSSNGFIDMASDMSGLYLTRPRHVLYKMTRPLGIGHLWDQIRLGPVLDNGKRDPSRIVVVVNADDLRAEGIELSRHLSWEKAAEDFVRQLCSNGRLDTLITCAHLIVRFDCDGIIHHRGGPRHLPPVLYFDPECVESEFAESNLGQMTGLTTAFTAGLAMGLATDPNNGLETGIRLGFAASRRLARTGFCLNPEDDAPDYAYADIMRDLQQDRKLAAVEIPSGKINRGHSWSILEETMGDPEAVARHIVQIGPNTALARVPTARFGRLITADRQEIESFRAITNLLDEYFKKPQTKPWGIGVFGPHGSGKAFAATHVAERAAQGRSVVRLEYNLSQFTNLQTLSAAFQTIRDHTLAGQLPMVFFDTFDAEFGMKLGWLRYFLAPMQMGNFLDHGQEHPIGNAIFFFIGSSFTSFAKFASPIDSSPEDPDRNAFYAAKGPDFISCLRGYIDIMGSDRISKSDHMYSIRRALLLRALLEKREPQLKVGERIIIDEAVLNGLLSIEKYRHGARSLEMILAMCTISGRREFERAALPAESQLNLHVDAKAFMNLVRYPKLDEKLRETIAKGLDEVCKQQRRKIAVTGAARKALDQSEDMLPWDDMKEHQRESTRSQADDIPHKLRMVNCYMAKEPRGIRPVVKAFTEDEVEILAIREHERWNAELLQKQWRNAAEGISPRKSYLIPWRDLDQHLKDFDRAMVECIPRILMLPGVGYHIYRLGTGGT